MGFFLLPWVKILKLPFMVTLEPPSFTKEQFPPKISGPASQTRLKNGGDVVFAPELYTP
jgi:hypothetical protein